MYSKISPYDIEDFKIRELITTNKSYDKIIYDFKVNNYIAHNKSAYYTYILPKIEYANTYHNVDENTILETYIDWILNERTIKKIVNMIQHMKINSNISEKSVIKYLKSKNIPFKTVTEDEDKNGIDLYVDNKKYQIKHCENIEVSDVITIKNSNIDLSKKYENLFLVSEFNIYDIKNITSIKSNVINGILDIIKWRTHFKKRKRL